MVSSITSELFCMALVVFATVGMFNRPDQSAGQWIYGIQIFIALLQAGLIFFLFSTIVTTYSF